MKSKKSFTAIIIVAVLLILGYAFYAVFINPNVPAVTGAKATDSTDTSVTLHWKASRCDGYYIYQMNEDEEYERIHTIKDPQKKEYVVEGLEDSTAYKFYITSFASALNSIHESEEYTVVDACTLPIKQEIISINNEEPLMLKVSWLGNVKVAGYEVQYMQGTGDDFSTAKIIDCDGSETITYEIKDLKENTDYSVRVRSYAYLNKERLYGEWSEAQSSTVIEALKLPDKVDVNKPMVALTYDDGPGYNDASDKVLDVLEKYNVKATFFMLGKNAKDNKANMKRKVELGMEIGNHTYNHSHVGSKVTVDDIKKSSEAIYEACGVYPTAFRSPGGSTTSLIRKECKKEKMPLYYWSVDTEDWKSKDADEIYKRVMKNVEDGDIILMHDIYPSTAEATKKIVPALIKKGYQLVTCRELVYIKTGKDPVAGEQYINAKTINNNTY